MKIRNFNREYLKYLFPQRTRLTTEYALTEESDQKEIDYAITIMAKKDYDMIREFLPSRADRVLDIGCGLGLIDGFIYEHCGNPDLHLLDKTELDTNKISGFNKTYRFYNNMDAAKNTLSSNGVDERKIHLHEANDITELLSCKFDLICSFLSCGWHYPIETYRDLICRTLKEDGTLILDIRHNTDQLDILSRDFVVVKQIYNYAESKHTGGNIGDRYVLRRSMRS